MNELLWGYHYNQAVHALNTVKYFIERGKAGSDVLEGKGPLIEEELGKVRENAARLEAELARIGSEMLARAD